MARVCTRICECLGHDFLPYMKAVMPFLIQFAQLQPATTSVSESDKASACFMLCQYAVILKEDFYPWIPQVVSVIIPLMKYYTDNKVRKCAVQGMYCLLRFAKLAAVKGIAQGGNESYFTKLSNHTIQSLVEALHEEHVPEICAFMLKELDKCLKIVVFPMMGDFPAWLNCLPIKADLYEAKCVHEQLCSMVERCSAGYLLKGWHEPRQL